MQLCSILKIEKSHIQKKCCQVISFLMVILFISMTLVQSFHAHVSSVITEQSDVGNFTYAIEKCKVCDFYLHKQTESIHSNYPPELATLLPTPISHNTHHYIGNYKFTLQGYTNKGPPQLLG
jgi:hypothetical protein